MLKNKFGMLKVLTLVLSVLMLVSLVACGNSGVAEEDMNAAIQAALEEQAKVEASKQEALASSLAAAQAEAEAKQAAAESSLAAAQAAASKAAADASKAAADAEKKASEAAASAAKAAAEASKAAASASEALKTTKPTTTTTTTTAAPIVKDDITAVQAKFAELKHELTNPLGNGKYYNAAEYAELTLLFDKAAVELQNAMTVAAAENILATVEVEARNIKNAKTEAAAIRDMIAGLGDIETGVFTTVLEKKDEAKLAVGQFYIDYAELIFDDPEEALKGIKDAEDMLKDLIGSDLELDVNDAEGEDESFKLKFGFNLDMISLARAEAKIEVLADYIADSLTDDMKELYGEFKYDFDEEGDDMLVTATRTNYWFDLVGEAYYKYLIVSAVNGGDVAAADLVTKYDFVYDEEGKKVSVAEDNKVKNPLTGEWYKKGDKLLDEEAPLEWFTAEEFMDVFAAPYLNLALQLTKDKVVNTLASKLTVARASNANADIYNNTAVVADNDYVAPYSEAQDALDEIFENFEAEMDELTFVGNYKGNATLTDAEIDVWTKYVDAYIAGANAIIETSKAYALERYADEYDDAVEALDDQYDERVDESSAAAKAQKLANLDAKKAAFEANIEALPTYTLEALTDIELCKKYDVNYNKENPYYDIVYDYITLGVIRFGEVDAKLINYINAVVVATLNKNFSSSNVTQTGILGDIAYGAVAELLALRDRLDPTFDEPETVKTLYTKDTWGSEISYIDGSDYISGKYYTNTAAFEKMLVTIDEAIEAIRNVNVEDFADEEIQIVTIDGAQFGDKNKKAKLYWVSQAAKDYVEKEGYTSGWLYSHENSTDTWYVSTSAKITYQVENDKEGNPVYKTEYLKVHEKDKLGNLKYEVCKEHGDFSKADYSEKKIADLIHAERLDDGSYVICNCEQTASVDSKVAYYERNDKGLTISNSSKSGDFLTLNNTGLPYTYTRTAEEKAILEVNKLYKAAFENVHKAVRALDTLNYLPTYEGKITGASEYKKILDNVAGSPELAAEVADFAKVYTGYLGTVNTGLVYAFSNEKFTAMAGTRDQIAQPSFTAGTESAYFTSNAAPNNASRYSYDNVAKCMDSIVSQFDSKFYTSNKTESNVVVLWNYKNAAVKYITDRINGYESAGDVWNAGYKNTYKVEVIDDKAVVTPRPGTLYKYDTGLKAASADGKAFDARLTELLDSYVAKIKGVKLNVNSDIKDFYGNKLASKADTGYQGNIGAGLKTGKWTISTARRTVNAYVVDLLGYAEAGIYVGHAKKDEEKGIPEYKDEYGTVIVDNVTVVYEDTDYTDVNGNTYHTGDSQVLVAFKNYYEKSYSAYAPAKPVKPAYCACGALLD